MKPSIRQLTISEHAAGEVLVRSGNDVLEYAHNPASPDDIRARGWMVAVHNDYRLNGELYTFWLFTKGDRAVKGEGKCDAEALNEVRRRLEFM